MSRGEGPRRAWVRWIVPVLTVALLAIFARSVDWTRALSAITHADATLVAVATAANLASLAVKAIRWWLFLRAAGVRSMRLAIRATFAGAALNNVLIANGGDAARVAAVARRANVSSASILATVAVDRFSDLATYAMMFVVAAFVLPLPPALAAWRGPSAIMLVALLGATVALVWWNAPTGRSSGHGPFHDATLLSRSRAYWRRLVSTSAAVATPGRVTAALSLAFVAWAGQWATFHYAARAASFPTTPGVSLLALLTVNASFLVRLTPGNIGVFQLLYALAATSARLDRNEAVAVAFLIQVIQYIPITLVGLLLAPSLVNRKDHRAARGPAPNAMSS